MELNSFLFFSFFFKTESLWPIISNVSRPWYLEFIDTDRALPFQALGLTMYNTMSGATYLLRATE